MRAEHERLRQALATASAPPPGREQQFRALLERAQPLLIAAGLYTSSAVEAKTQLLTDIASALTKCAAPRCKHCKDTGRIESGNGYDAEVCYDCDAYQRETDILLGRQPPKEIGP